MYSVLNDINKTNPFFLYFKSNKIKKNHLQHVPQSVGGSKTAGTSVVDGLAPNIPDIHCKKGFLSFSEPTPTRFVSFEESKATTVALSFRLLNKLFLSGKA